QTARLISKLLDDEPVLDEMLLKLGKWIADYYSAPLGEVLRGMLPLSGEFRRKKTYTLTEAGHDAARQLVTTEDSDPATAILRLLVEHPRTEQYLSGKTKNARPALKALIKRGWVMADETHEERDPLRLPAEKLLVEFMERAAEGTKLRKPERELLAFLELHPGPHNL